MSPQPTLLPPVRRIPTRALDLADFPCPPARRLRAMPNTDVPKTDLLPPLVINPAPPFHRAAPLKLVEVEAPARSGGVGSTAKTLAGRQIRLTRRGRLTLVAAAVLCMLLGFSLGNTLSSTAGTISPPAASHSIVVQPGQTLWGIATQVAPHADPRATVQQIIVLNHLPTTGLQAGETLSVPS